MSRPLKCYGNKKSSRKASEAGQSGQEDQLEESHQWGGKVRKCHRRVPEQEKVMQGHLDYYKDFRFYSA